MPRWNRFSSNSNSNSNSNTGSGGLIRLLALTARTESRTGCAVGVHDSDTLTARMAGGRPMKMCLAGMDAPECGQPLEGLYNEGKDALYRWKRVGEVGQTTVMDTKTIKQFLESDQPGSIPVAVLPTDIRDRLGANTDKILLSRYTADKQRKHPEITEESDDWLQDLIDQGERVFNKPLHTVVIQYRGEWFVAVLKVTKAGNEVYLQSFRRSDAKDIAKLRGAEKK